MIPKVSPSIRAGLIGFCAAVVVTGGVGVAVAAVKDDPSPAAASGSEAGDPTPTPALDGFQGELRTEDFPVNSHGLTYGSSAKAAGPEAGPDLIAIVGEKGVLGFAYAKDVYGHEINTPEDAVAYERKLQENGPQRINIYDVEGVTVVDTFVPNIGAVSYEEPKIP